MPKLPFPSPSANNDFNATSIAELQGALCGLLCLNPKTNRDTWYKMLLEDLEPDDDDRLDLVTLFDQTLQSLESQDFDLQLALPDDDAPISHRLSALANWCQGLVFGLGVSGLSNNTQLSSDTNEYINDIIKISQINHDDVKNDKENENYLIELTQYVRIGLFLIYEELHTSYLNIADNHNIEHEQNGQ